MLGARRLACLPDTAKKISAPRLGLSPETFAGGSGYLDHYHERKRSGRARLRHIKFK
jgi:hypothetical protein